MSAKFLITPKSGNKKVGPIMVTTSPRTSCPDACPFRRDNTGGCYAEAFPLALFWTALDNGAPGATVAVSAKQNVRVHTLADLCDAITSQPIGALWRHNQAGDLIPDASGDICRETLAIIADANTGRRGFTYTHHDIVTNARNREAIRAANKSGFTINLSANNLAHADKLAALNVGPVVTTLPHDASTNTTTPAGRKVVICPATQREGISCATCQLCQRASRDCIVGFPAHGPNKRKVSNLATGGKD